MIIIYPSLAIKQLPIKLCFEFLHAFNFPALKMTSVLLGKIDFDIILLIWFIQ